MQRPIDLQSLAGEVEFLKGHTLGLQNILITLTTMLNTDPAFKDRFTHVLNHVCEGSHLQGMHSTMSDERLQASIQTVKSIVGPEVAAKIGQGI